MQIRFFYWKIERRWTVVRDLLCTITLPEINDVGLYCCLIYIYIHREEELDLWSQFRTSLQDSHRHMSHLDFRFLRISLVFLLFMIIKSLLSFLSLSFRSPRKYFAACPAMSNVLHHTSIPVIHSPMLLQISASSVRLSHVLRFYFVHPQNIFFRHVHPDYWVFPSSSWVWSLWDLTCTRAAPPDLQFVYFFNESVT